MKHVSKSTWEHLKEKSAVDLYAELHHEAPDATTSAPGSVAEPEAEHPTAGA